MNFRSLNQTELDWERVDDFSYTIKRFGLINRTMRHSWAYKLHVLFMFGPEEAREYRRMEQDDF